MSYMCPRVCQGERLDLGCTAGDYSVTVGDGRCIVLDLHTNQLVCRPPPLQTRPRVLPQGRRSQGEGGRQGTTAGMGITELMGVVIFT